MNPRCDAIEVAPSITLYHSGPSLDHGPLPTLFYFSLSGPDSLTLDPFNQPVQFLQGKMVRIFSMTLPGHEQGLLATEAMQVWASDFEKRLPTLDEFLDGAQKALAFAQKEGFILKDRMGIMGLSRGAFIAAHLAAKEPAFRFFVGFAPLTRLGTIKEFQHLKDAAHVKRWDLHHLAEKLSDRHSFFFIGNEDSRVGTKDCFDFVTELVKAKKTRSCFAQLFIYPSIGQMGHGTPPEIFKQGADFLFSHLEKK